MVNVINIENNTYSIPSEIKKLDLDGVIYDIGLDTSDATATENDILLGKTVYVNGSKITGTIPEYGPVTTITSMRYDGVRIIAESQYGYYTNYDSNLKTIYYLPQNDVASAIGLTADILKSGTNILGVSGNLISSDAMDILAWGSLFYEPSTNYMTYWTGTTYAKINKRNQGNDTPLNLTIPGTFKKCIIWCQQNWADERMWVDIGGNRFYTKDHADSILTFSSFTNNKIQMSPYSFAIINMCLIGVKN